MPAAAGVHPPEPENGSPGATGLVSACCGLIRQARWVAKSDDSSWVAGTLTNAGSPT